MGCLNLNFQRNKGQLVFNTIIVGLFAIGTMIFLYVYFLNSNVRIYTYTLEYTTERHALILANDLISSPNLTFVDSSGTVYRGILDKEKLDRVFKAKSSVGFNSTDVVNLLNPQNFISSNDLGGYIYPDSITEIMVVDLDRCSDKGCYTWGGLVYPDFNLASNPSLKFLNCIAENFDNSEEAWRKRLGTCAVGAVIGSVVPGVGTLVGAAIGCGVGLISTLWSPSDVQKCLYDSIPEAVKNFFITGNPASHQGLPVLIRYGPYNFHQGRIIVGLTEWYT